MKMRHAMLAATAFLMLAGCSWMPHFGRHKPEKGAQLTLMKSLAGEVDYDLVQTPPPDAYLEVTLSEVNPQTRVIATDRIAPLGPSPVSFVLSYEPPDLGNGTDFTVTARIKQANHILASTDVPSHVLGTSGNDGPVRVVVSGLH